ncbi:MAG TPA: haloacid dehalogenase [Eggerthellaceae bacterium]|nr:haloacid dehalogenase [Eggerthellaceae bacterium]
MREFEDEIRGLSSEEVAAAQAAGDANADAGTKTRSVKDILRDNVCTLFNLVNVILFAFVLITGSLQNGLFMIVIVVNTAIGIVQEIRSKQITDQLSIVASSKAKVIRDGVRGEVPLEELVRGDCIVLGRGDQIPCDSTVLTGTANVDESLLTGESDLIPKAQGAQLMSGSFVNSGTVVARVDHVGAENYAAKISAEAKAQKDINSEIMTSLNNIIKFVSIIIFPVGLLLFGSMFWANGVEFNQAILSSVAALVGMVPEGLILLTSTVLALAVIRLSKHRVLVQQLYCIETLAHVDTLCLDKTGTITSGAMEVQGLTLLGDASAREEGDAEQEAISALVSIAAADPDANETGKAILAWAETLNVQPVAASAYVPFSSDRKWSGATLPPGAVGKGADGGAEAAPGAAGADASRSQGASYVMGAGQFVLGEGFAAVADQVEAAAEHARVLVLARVQGFDGERIVGTPQPIAFVAIRDQIRTSAAETIGYFCEQGVDVKVISGDDPRTVSGIAQQVGVPHADRFIDATTLDTDEKIVRAVSQYSIFGRVKPEQKKAFVVALQDAGHTVAMTGDGVNDTLALKQADCSVAMAAGSDAARNVAQLVLVDNDFASMPKVVAEGRRSINNLQRSASLFLVKTLFSMVLAALFILLPWQYPYQPIQMTLISAFTIGLPSFVLALEPNRDRIKGHFLENVVVKSIPGAVTVVLAVLAVNAWGYLGVGLDHAQVSTLCVLLTAWIGVNLIFRVSMPFTPIRIALIIVVVVGTIAGAALFPNLFAISAFVDSMWTIIAVVGIAAVVLFNVLYGALDRWHAARQAVLV